MIVAIAGGHGKIAQRLTRRLVGAGHGVRGLIRNPDHADDLRALGAEPVVCDLEAAQPAEVASAVGDAAAIVFAAGAGPGSGAARKDTMDHGGAAKLIAAARATGIERYLMVSSIGAGDPPAPGGDEDDVFAAYLRAKARADADLQESGLAYTIVRPGRLTDAPGSGRVQLGEHLPGGSISRDDVAHLLAAALGEPATVGRTFDAVAGDAPIDDALSGLAAS